MKERPRVQGWAMVPRLPKRTRAGVSRGMVRQLRRKFLRTQAANRTQKSKIRCPATWRLG